MVIQIWIKIEGFHYQNFEKNRFFLLKVSFFLDTKTMFNVFILLLSQ